jgi:hypothetical protein
MALVETKPLWGRFRVITGGIGNLRLQKLPNWPAVAQAIELDKVFAYCISDSFGNPIEAGYAKRVDAENVERVEVRAQITNGALTLENTPLNIPVGYFFSAVQDDSQQVLSVAGRTGAVVLTKADVGLSNVDNESAENLRDRSTHSGTQLANTISDFLEATQDAIASTLVQGDNVTISYNDATGQIMISAGYTAKTWETV